MELQDITKIYDCPHSTAPDEGQGYALIRTPNIGKGRLLLDGVHRISESAYKLRNKRATPQEGDIIFAREAPAGNAALITKGQLVCLGQRTVLIRPNNDIANSEYLTYYLLAPQQQARLLGLTHGSTVSHVNIPDLSKLKVALPSLPIQQRIASILSTYDNLIENNTKRIKLLEQMAENLYKEWFVRFRFPGHENVEMENGLPKGWKNEPLESICTFKRGKNITSSEICEGNVPVISAGLSPSGYHNKANVYGVSITMSSSGANAGYISVHYDDIWAADCSYISEEQTEDIYYAYELLNNIRPVINNFQIGSAQPHVYPKDVNRIKMCIPPKELRTKANGVLSKFHKEIYKLQKQNIPLTRQRDFLLPRLMSGKLEVKA